MIDANTDPAAVGHHVINSIGDGLTQLLVEEIMDLHLLGLALGLPFPPAVAIAAHKPSFFLVSTETTGWPCRWNALALRLMYWN